MSPPAAVAAPAFCLCLHIRHPSLDPQEISRELQLTPEAAFGAGKRRSRSYLGAGVHGQTYWAAQLGPEYWRKVDLHSFAPRSQEDPAAADEALPQNREARFKRLVERGQAQGYLTHLELRAHLPRDPIEDVVRALGELGIPVHAQASPALKVIQRLRGLDLGAMTHYLDQHPAPHVAEVLTLVCLRLATQHAVFLEKVRASGGSVRLLVTLSSKAVHGLTLTPELSGRFAQLGITLELAHSAGSSVRRSKAGAS